MRCHVTRQGNIRIKFWSESPDLDYRVRWMVTRHYAIEVWLGLIIRQAEAVETTGSKTAGERLRVQGVRGKNKGCFP
jgi:hypothetical protein